MVLKQLIGANDNMNIDESIAQYASELKYSKKNLIKIVLDSMYAQDNHLILEKLIKGVNEYIHNSYWDSKNDYITAINMIDISPIDIAEHIIITTLTYPNTVINNVASAIGNIFEKYIDDVFIRVQIGADLLLACEDIIYDLTVTSNDGIMFKSWIALTYKEQLLVNEFMYQPPMKAKPLSISNNYMSPYYTFNESVILGNKYCNHNKYVALDILNIQNNIPFELDKHVIATRHSPKKELKGQDLTNWKQYTKEQGMLFNEYVDREFFITTAFDSRGRLYSKGHHINYQADEYNKACLNLARKEICV